jgi:hypothetical protein
MNIIGISGLAGSGKDTIADYLYFKHVYQKVSLADVMKRFVMEVWGVDKECLWGPSHLRGATLPVKIPGTDETLTVRKILQHLGTEGGRAIDNDVWARYAMRVAKTLILPHPLTGRRDYVYTPEYGLKQLHPDAQCGYAGVTIPDCRFVNEIKLIREEGGILLRVKRPGSGLDGKFALHRSEQELLDVPDSHFDYVIDNNGSISDLQDKVDEFVAVTFRK